MGLGLEKPIFDAQQWHKPLNRNFTKLEGAFALDTVVSKNMATWAETINGVTEYKADSITQDLIDAGYNTFVYYGSTLAPTVQIEATSGCIAISNMRYPFDLMVEAPNSLYNAGYFVLKPGETAHMIISGTEVVVLSLFARYSGKAISYQFKDIVTSKFVNLNVGTTTISSFSSKQFMIKGKGGNGLANTGAGLTTVRDGAGEGGEQHFYFSPNTVSRTKLDINIARNGTALIGDNTFYVSQEYLPVDFQARSNYVKESVRRIVIPHGNIDGGNATAGRLINSGGSDLMYGTGRGIGGGSNYFSSARIIVPWIGSLDYVGGVKGEDGYSPAVSVDYAKEIGRGGGVYGALAKESSNNAAVGTLAGIGGGGTGDTAGTTPISFITGYANRSYAFI